VTGSTAPSTTVWVDVCALADLVPDRGVAALVGGCQVAVFLVEGELFALSNYDPFSQAFVVSRGIVGSRGDRLKVASPIYKQSFDLRTGQCLDDPDVAVPTFEVRAVDGRVVVAEPPPAAGGAGAR
jgi:nitrite reductase (NADH) small subunit